MKDFEVLSRKIREICLEHNSLRIENERLLKEESRLKEKINMMGEQAKSINKTIRQNELLNEERKEIKKHLNNLKVKLEKAF